MRKGEGREKGGEKGGERGGRGEGEGRERGGRGEGGGEKVVKMLLEMATNKMMPEGGGESGQNGARDAVRCTVKYLWVTF